MTAKAQCGGILTGKGLVTTDGVLEVAVGGAIEFVGDNLALAPMANQAQSVASTNPTVAEFNALLTKLKTAGFMVAD